LRGREDLVDLISTKRGAEAACKVEIGLYLSTDVFKTAVSPVPTFVVLREKVRALRSVRAIDGIAMEAGTAH
jgi:hypothetical protein